MSLDNTIDKINKYNPMCVSNFKFTKLNKTISPKKERQILKVRRSMKEMYEYITLSEIEKNMNFIVFRSSQCTNTSTKLYFGKLGKFHGSGTPYCFNTNNKLLACIQWRKMISNTHCDDLEILTDSGVYLPSVEHRFNYIKLKKYCGYEGSIIAESINWDKLTPYESYFISESHLCHLSFDENNWKKDRVSIMNTLLREKFKPDNIYGRILRETKKHKILYYEMPTCDSGEVLETDKMFTQGAIESITRMLKKDNPSAILNEKIPLIFKIALLYKNQTFPRMRNREKAQIEKDVPYWGVRVIRYKKSWEFQNTTSNSQSSINYRTHDVIVGENHIGQILMNIRQDHASDWYGEGEPWLNN